MLITYVVVIQSDRRLRRYHLFVNCWRSEWSRFFEMLRIGTPISLTILAEAGLFTGAAFLMGRIGEAELAGHTIALQVAALAFQIPFGIAPAATIHVALASGPRHRRRIPSPGHASPPTGIRLIGFLAF